MAAIPRCVCLIVLALVVFATGEPSLAQPLASSAADLTLRAEAEKLIASHHGRVALFAEQLNTGKRLAIDADLPVQTASVIKLAVLFEAMEQVRSGKAHWQDKVTLAPGDAVTGSGLLGFLDPPLTLTLKDVLTLMVIVSDNTATNLSIDRLGLDAINARIAWMGLRDTHLYKRIMKPPTGPMPEDQPRFGLGKTTAHEMARVLERIGRCQLAGPREASQPGDAAICTVALTMLRNQFYRDTIPRYLETLDSSEVGSGIASKTGSLNAVRADVAIVAGRTGPIVLSIFTYQNADTSWSSDNEAEITIAKLAKSVVTAWSPTGIDGAKLVPGLGLDAASPAAATMDKNASAASK